MLDKTEIYLFCPTQPRISPGWVVGVSVARRAPKEEAGRQLRCCVAVYVVEEAQTGEAVTYL